MLHIKYAVQRMLIQLPVCLFRMVKKYLVVLLLGSVVLISSQWQKSFGDTLPPPCHVCVYINKSLTRTEITISWLQKRISFTKIHEQQLKCFPLVIHNLQKTLFTSRSFPIFKTDGISQRLLENITD